MERRLSVSVLREGSELAAVAAHCADFAMHCVELPSLMHYPWDGARCVLVWDGEERLAGLFPFGAPALHREIPLLVLTSSTPFLRAGYAHAALHALLDWFRADGEGAALIEFSEIAYGGAVYRALAEVAREREQVVLEMRARDRSRTLLVSDRSWHELTMTTLPLTRWAKRSAASLVHGLGTPV